MSTFEALKLAYLRSTGKEEPGVLALLACGSVSGSIGAIIANEHDDGRAVSLCAAGHGAYSQCGPPDPQN